MPMSHKYATERTARSEKWGALAAAPRLLLFVSLALNFVAFISILRHSDILSGILSQDALFTGWYADLTVTGIPLDTDTERCAPLHTTEPPSDSALIPTNPWRSLTLEEITDVRTWLEQPQQNLNLTRSEASKVSDNIIFLIEAYYPTKDAAVAYLASPAAVAPPERHARVTINHGGQAAPEVRDYLVGPLPISGATRMRALTEIYHNGPSIPYNARGVSDVSEMGTALARIIEPIADIMQELFGASARGYKNDTLVAGLSGPFSFDGAFRRGWISWRHNHAGSYLLPVNFYQYLDTSGTDSSQWRVLKLVYHGQIFDTTDAFVEAFHNGTLVRHPPSGGRDLSWTERTRRGPPRDLDERPGPRSVSFAGLRFRVDRAQQHVRWMGWALYLGFDRDMGLSLWDINFRGERIIYQLSPQEALAQYGGNDPMQPSTAWLDRYFGMGSLVRNMIPHYDCPQEAVYLPALTYTPGGIVAVERAICIFEQDTGKPLTRHFGYQTGEFGATKSYVLTIRSTTTIGNYDYLFDYLFYLDGTMEVRISASGYMQGGYWNSDQEGYGARIHETSMGNLHDHIINYKVDFDIAGTKNSMLKITTNQERVVHPWLDDGDWGSEVIQQKITKEYVTSENDSLLNYPPNLQGGYVIVNKDSLNRWGYPRGYLIHPGQNPIHNTVVGSKRLLNNANWARYNLAVSRRKETEPSSSSMWNLNLPGAPKVDFHKFFDGESLTQRDLVAWVNVGMHHLPQSEDSPQTKTNVATSSFTLTPWNYFDSDISMELQNAVLLQTPKNAGDPYAFDDYGVKQDFTCVPERPAPFKYSNRNTDGSVSETFAETEDGRRNAEMYMRVRVG